MKLSRRRVLQGGAVGAIGAAVSSHARSSTSGRPNIVLVITDQHTERAVGAHGRANALTPNMDRLIAEGTSFAASYCADPSCVPARAAIFSGRPSCEHGALINPLPLEEDVADLGQWMSEYSGYNCYYMGKWHIPGRTLSRSFQLKSYYSGAGENCDVALLRSLEGFLQNYNESEPFFLVLSVYNPHDIVHLVTMQGGTTDPLDMGLSSSDLPPLPPNFRMPPREAEVFKAVKRADSRTWSQEKWQHFRWWYDRQVEMMDGVVGRVGELLFNSAYASNTALLLTSDHGDNQAEHQLLNKQTLYEAASKVPLIAVWPEEWAARGIDERHIVSGLDIFPTVCDLAGIEPPSTVRGRSLVPLLDGSATEWREYLQVQSLVEGRLIRTADHVWITYKDDPVELLFDIRADPWQLDDLSQDSSYASMLDDMRARQDEVEATFEPTELSLLGYAAAAEAAGV